MVNELSEMIDKKKATVKDLQKLTGRLNFLCRAIHSGRAFTRCMYAKYSYDAKSCDNNQTQRKKQKLLKQHHHVQLDKEFKDDCKVWLSFLQNKMIAVSRPFVDLQTTLNAEVLDWYTDSAKGKLLGFGGVHGQHWFFGQWEVGYIDRYDPSIEYLELYAVCVSIYLWTNSIKDKRIVLFCDNQAVVNIINNSSARCKNCMKLIRLIMSRYMLFNCRVFARWVRGSSNSRVDLLSRQKISQFKQITCNAQIDDYPESLLQALWPASKIWIK